MRPARQLSRVGVVVVLAAAGSFASLLAQDQAAGLSYDDFQQFDQEARSAAWVEADPDTKARLAQAHTSRWLDANRARLSSTQIELIEEARALLTPGFYAESDADVKWQREQAMLARLECSLWRSDLMNAFGPIGSPVPFSWQMDVGSWIDGCLLGR